MPTAPDARTSFLPSRERASATRTLLAALGLASAAVLSACSTSELPSAPEPSADLSASLHRGGGNDRLSKIEQFAMAQGTFCDDATGATCAGPFTDLGIGYIIANYAWPPENQQGFYTADFGGVNARWWARNALSPRYPKYRIEGDVRETRLSDGRRRLRITAEIENTFTFVDIDFFDDDDNYITSDRLLGADFFEYPGIDPDLPDLTPQLADMTIDFDLVLPADFVGMPDVAEMWFLDVRKPGMEIRKMDVTTEATGRLRSAYNGMPVGAKVRVKIRDNFSEGLTPTPSYTPPQFTITRIGRDRDDREPRADRKKRDDSDGPSRRGRNHRR
jgi:hypothetical protein